MLKKLLSISCLVFCLANEAQANQALPFNELRFANRAQCAIDSEQPTTSTFILLDGYNAGRVASNAAKNLGLDPETTARTAMNEFRLASAHLLQLILQRLSSGQLPLLPTNVDESQNVSIKKYQSVAIACENNPFCPALREYLRNIWTQSAHKQTDQLRALKVFDNFQRSQLLELHDKPVCSHLKKFSPLQAPLHTTGITAEQLNSIAQTAINSSEFITNCDTQEEGIDSRHVALQIDIPYIQTRHWNHVGFDFWNSVKIYMSWAWRYAPELAQKAPQFHVLLRNLDYEESILFMPNGCKSITLPQCDNQTVAVNAIRELAKRTGTLTEFDNLVSTGPEQNLIDRGARSVNNDFLETLSYDKANEWVANFRKNFVETRWIMKNKVFNANQTLTAITANFTPAEIGKHIRAMILEPGVPEQVRNEAAYMCLEWRLSSDDKLDFLSSDIERVTQLQTMSQVNQVGLNTEQQIQLFKDLNKVLEPICESLEQTEFFRHDSYTTDWSGLAPWAKEMLNSSLPQEQKVSEKENFIPTLIDGIALLSMGDPATVVCANGMDCARKVFKSAVDIYTASTYAEAFLPVTSTPMSADVFNPYAELKACKVYDPWFQTNRIRKVFVADLLNTALVGWTPIPLYMDVNFSAPKVTSFNQLLEDGKIKFDPNVQKSKMMAALVADFGPLMGSPCAIQFSPNADKPFDFYAFNGISMNYCNVRAKHDGTSQRPGDVQVTDPKNSSFCAGCSLNFVGVASGASSVHAGSSFNPLKFGVYLFRSIHRFFKGMKDKTNIPNTYTININHVVDAYKSNNGTIPEHCVQSLSQGFRCYQDICASKLAHAIETDWKAAPASIRYSNDRSSRGAGNYRKVAQVHFKHCNGGATINFSCNRDGGRWWVDLVGAQVSNSCKRFFRGLR